MYTVSPASGRIGSGECLKIQGEYHLILWVYEWCWKNTHVITVLRKLVDVEPPAHIICTDTLSLLGTVIYPDQEHLSSNDVVRIHYSLRLFHWFWLLYLQWTAAWDNKRAIFQRRLPILFIPRQGFTPEEELIKARQGLFDRLQDTKAFETVDRLRQTQANEADTSWEQLTEAQEDMVSLTIWCLEPHGLYPTLIQLLMCLLADSTVVALSGTKHDSRAMIEEQPDRSRLSSIAFLPATDIGTTARYLTYITSLECPKCRINWRTHLKLEALPGSSEICGVYEFTLEDDQERVTEHCLMLPWLNQMLYSSTLVTDSSENSIRGWAGWIWLPGNSFDAVTLCG